MSTDKDLSGHCSLSSEGLQIGAGEVHLWFGFYGDMLLHFKELECILTGTERERAEKYHFIIDRNRFILRRGILRNMIGRYKSIDPKEIRFKINQYGKPFVVNGKQGSPLEFNLSHSKEMVLYAFTLGRRIGVDIEYVRSIKDIKAIVENNFSSNEKVEFNVLPANIQQEAFYHCWAQKEAFLKALGDGLSRRLDQFDVSMIPDSPAVLKRTLWDEEEAGRWSLTSIHSIPGYTAALAVEGGGHMLQCRKLTM